MRYQYPADSVPLSACDVSPRDDTESGLRPFPVLFTATPEQLRFVCSTPPCWDDSHSDVDWLLELFEEEGDCVRILIAGGGS